MSQHDTLTLREALRSIQYEAASLADAQVIALQALNATYPARAALSATQPAQAAQCGIAGMLKTTCPYCEQGFAFECQTCNGHGLIGGHMQDGSGYAEPCPDCNSEQPAQAAQGEPFGFVHHYVAHDSQGRIIDSTWEADGCEDEMPHPTHPIKWRWERSEPFYTKTAVAQGAGEVVPYAYAVYFPDQPTEMLVHDLDDLCEDMTNREHTVTQLYTQPAAGADVLDAVMYLLQDTRSYVCNCVVWRAKDGNGYTTDVAKAHRYTFDEAMRQHRSRDTDLPWPCDEVLPLARGHVDVQDVHKIRSLDDQRAAIAASGRQE